MKMNKLGNTDVMLPEICLGTMTWGEQNTEEEAHAQLDYAVDECGLIFIDTAEAYPIPPEPGKQGSTETIIGNWLARRGRREDLFIATKVSPGGIVTTRDHEGGRPRLDRKSIREAVEGSLSRLQTDYIDLYQVHWPERQTNYFGRRGYDHDMRSKTTTIEETLTVLGELVDEGVIRHIGVSNETPWGISEYLRLSREKDLPRIVSIQNQYSLVNRTFEIGLAEMCIQEDISLLAYSVLNMGVLTGKYLDGARPEGARFTLVERNTERYNSPTIQPVVRAYVDLARAHNLDPAEMAIAFAKTRDFTTSVIIGASNMEQLKMCIETSKLEPTPEVLRGIENIYQEHPDPGC